MRVMRGSSVGVEVEEEQVVRGVLVFRAVVYLATAVLVMEP